MKKPCHRVQDEFPKIDRQENWTNVAYNGKSLDYSRISSIQKDPQKFVILTRESSIHIVWIEKEK